MPFDLLALLNLLRQTAEGGLRDLANRLASLLAGVPDRRLEQLMRTPARRIVIETIFTLMPRYLDRAKVGTLNLSVRWRVTAAGPRGPEAAGEAGADVFDLVIADRRARLLHGPQGPAPLVTITISDVELLRLALGRTNPMQAYFDRRLTLRGDIMQAARLSSVLRPPPVAARRAAGGENG